MYTFMLTRHSITQELHCLLYHVHVYIAIVMCVHATCFTSCIYYIVHVHVHVCVHRKQRSATLQFLLGACFFVYLPLLPCIIVFCSWRRRSKARARLKKKAARKRERLKAKKQAGAHPLSMSNDMHVHVHVHTIKIYINFTYSMYIRTMSCV